MTKGIIKVKADKLNKPKKQERESDFFLFRQQEQGENKLSFRN